MATAGLVLAAGAGTRYGRPKAPVEVDGERLVDRAVRVLTEGGCEPVVVVLGAWVGTVDGARVVVNEDWPEGIGSSLRAGLAALESDPAVDAVVVTLVDLPGLSGTAVGRIVDCPAPLAAATYQGQRGHPVRLGREYWPEVVRNARGDVGARAVLEAGHDVALVEVADVADGYDVDVPDT